MSEVKASSFLTLGQASGFNCEVIQIGWPLFATKGFVYKAHQDCISYLIMDVPTLRMFFSPILTVASIWNTGETGDMFG